MQLKYRKLLALARRISAINATIRRPSQNSRRRDQEADGQARIGNPNLTRDDDDASFYPTLNLEAVPIPILSITLGTFSGSTDTLYNSAVDSEVGSDSDYYTDSASTTRSTFLDNHSYLTAQEGVSVKKLSMDPLSAQISEVNSPAPSPVAEEQAPPRSPASPSADNDEALEGAHETVFDKSSTDGVAPGAVEDSSQSMPSEYDTRDDALLASPPPVLVEPELPDPFIVDDGEESDEDSRYGDEGGLIESITPSVAAEDEIALAQSILVEPGPSTPTQTQYAAPIAPITSPFPQPALFTPQPNASKDVPSLPSAASSEEEDEEPPELYLPGLVLPTMFLPIPNTDPLSTLLTKFVPPEKRPSRDLSGEWQRTDFHTLVMTNSWRALARMARDRIVSANPEDLALILSLWYLRLASLARIRLFNQTSAECTNLFTVLNAVAPPSARTWLLERMLPFELEVLHAKTQYWAGDHMGYLDALSTLLARCKTQARAAGRKRDQAGVAMWKERGARMCLIVASQLIEMKDYTAAARLLEPLCRQEEGISSPHLRSAVARIYLQSGHVAMAVKHFAAVVEDPTAEPSLRAMNAALLASAEGDWARATNALRQILQNDPENYVAVNNLAVALLSQGHLKEGIQILEDALRASPSTIVVAEPFLFNLSTLYELRSRTAADKKRELLVEVAKWAGDGLRIACLKMPST